VELQNPLKKRIGAHRRPRASDRFVQILTREQLTVSGGCLSRSHGAIDEAD
jgi:hypothetical protein